MWKKAAAILWTICAFAVTGNALGQDTSPSSATSPADKITADVVTIWTEQQYEKVRPNSKSALAVHFQLEKDWHFYASEKTAPAAMNLKINPSPESTISFAEPIFPQPISYFDKSSDQTLEVFGDRFTVFLPFTVEAAAPPDGQDQTVNVKISVEGAVCSDIQCRVPDFSNLNVMIRISPDAVMSQPKFALPELPGQRANYSAWFALGLAFLAGLSLNIMPCVWPVLPIIVMRIVEQAKQTKGRSITMGLAFCLGILLFFACLAIANIILQLFYGTVLQWGDQFRNPAFVAGMALLLVALALFMFGAFTITVPSAIASKSSSGKGYCGAVGMGFLAAILSTPCSFAILAAAFAWAQAQRLWLGTLAIMVIGLGMAAPYAILTSMPGLLKRTPKPGRWMELFKQTIGFVLLIIAVKLITALPDVRKAGVLYFAVVLSFCIWMWGGWVTYNTRFSRKWLTRIIAIALAITAGFLFLPPPAEGPIDWQHYDTDLIQTALTRNRPVLIKFTADWCLVCEVVEKMVYSKKDIARLIEQKGVLPIKADTTVWNYPAAAALKNKYKEPGVPVSMLFVPDIKDPVRWHGLSFADELRQLLETLPPK